MRAICVPLVLGFATLTPAEPARPLDEVCRAVERRYNSARSLSAHFDQRFHAPGRLPRAESGELVLRKPGRMRWDYSAPEGKTFVCDGKWIWFYSPAARKVERSPVKDTEDLRAPLAFLLGKLDFRREFKDLALHASGSEVVLEALPKTATLPYRRVEFTLAGDAIRKVVVTGEDQSVMEFVFSNERLNVTVDESRLRFTPPAGVGIVDVEALTAEESH